VAGVFEAGLLSVLTLVSVFVSVEGAGLLSEFFADSGFGFRG